MSGLNTSLSVAVQSLLTQEAAIQVANNNIANANTPGYARETVVLSTAAPIEQGSVALGDGATLLGFSSVRDQLLDLRIQQQSGDQSSADAQAGALKQIQTLLPSSGSSVGSALSAFFASLSSLSANPTSAAARQTVLSSAQDLASQFNSTAASLTTQQASLNTRVATNVDQINQLSSQVAALNQQLAQLAGTGQNTGPVQDQLSHLELQLARLTNLSVSHTASGDTLTTGNGIALVLGSQSYALHTATAADGQARVYDVQNHDITATLSTGDLGGTLRVRDTNIPGLLNSLDTLANQFAGALNTAQASGYDQNGAAGTALFSLPAGVAGSAASIKVLITDPALIAASSDGSAGSNGNVAGLAAVQTTKLASGLSPTDAYAGLVYQAGTLTATATTQSAAIAISLSQLSQQQSSVSGVSIDEESANLLRYQQAYEASARVITTIATLFNATLQMGG